MDINTIKNLIVESVSTNITKISADTLNWLSILVGHCIFVPSILALITGLTDQGPNADVVIMVQLLLLLSFARSVIVKDTVAAVTHGLGWFAQGLLLSMIVFK